LVCLLLPFALFFYETDEDDTFCQRVVKGIVYTFAANIISILLLFITWNFFKFVELPVHAISASATTTFAGADLNNWTLTQSDSDVKLELEASFAVYVIAIMSFFGWICVVVCGGVGLFGLPLDMINDFRNRPKPRKSNEMAKTKTSLSAAVSSMLKEGEELKKKDEDHAANSESGWFDKWRGRRQIDNKMTEFKAKFSSLEEEVEIFNLELNYYDTNPITPVLKLLLGIVFFVTSILWMLQM
jgi:hypothetical protein